MPSIITISNECQSVDVLLITLYTLGFLKKRKQKLPHYSNKHYFNQYQPVKMRHPQTLRQTQHLAIDAVMSQKARHLPYNKLQV